MSLNESGENHFYCVAVLAECDAMRYTPAGVPMMTARLVHESEQLEAGIQRQVVFEMQAVAAGQIAGQLAKTELGKAHRFSGFMARKNRNSKSLVFHLTDIATISEI